MSSLFLSLLVLGWVSSEPSPLETIGRLDGKIIPEASGIVKSRRFADIFWVHNDSGNPPLLFAIRGDGRVVRQFRVGIPNIDWEDVAIDNQGHLYLGDIGNNMKLLPRRVIYRIDEPDPRSRAEKAISVLSATFYDLPPENRFDAESLFVDGGNATVVTKYLDGREAELFTLSLKARSSLSRPAHPQTIGRLPRFTEPATGADLKADGTLLAVCSPVVARVYDRDRNQQARWRLVAEVRYPAAAIEGIAWDGNALILVAEGGGFYRLSEKTWRAAKVAVPDALPSRPAPYGRKVRESH